LERTIGLGRTLEHYVGARQRDPAHRLDRTAWIDVEPGGDMNLSFTVSVAVVPGGAVGGMTVGSARGRRAAAVGPDRYQAVAGAESLGPEDHVVLKSTSMPWAIAPGG
jgi:hypothetical protein